jgi:hypothetical protein
MLLDLWLSPVAVMKHPDGERDMGEVLILDQAVTRADGDLENYM